MYNFKKIAALGLALTMALGSSLTAFASSPSTDADGDINAKVDTAVDVVGTGTEEYIDKNIMKVTMPTDDAIDTFFDYKLDPQGLIAEAKSYGSTAVTGTATGIVFLNTAGGKSVISNTSDTFKITNKSSIPVDLGVSVQLTGNDFASKISTTSDFSGTDATNAIYLGLKATNDVEHALSTTLTNYNTVLLSGASQYETRYDTTANKYVYAAKANAKFSDFTFNVTGAINTALGNDTWVTISGEVGDRTVEAKTAPVITLKVTLNPIADPLSATLKWTSVTTNGAKEDVLTVAKVGAASGKGGFVAADVNKVYVNGRDTAFTIDENGYINVTLQAIYGNYYGSSTWGDATAATKSAVKTLIKNVKTTQTSKPTFYGQL